MCEVRDKTRLVCPAYHSDSCPYCLESNIDYHKVRIDYWKRKALYRRKNVDRKWHGNAEKRRNRSKSLKGVRVRKLTASAIANDTVQDGNKLSAHAIYFIKSSKDSYDIRAGIGVFLP